MKTYIRFLLFCFALAFVSCAEEYVAPATTNTVISPIEEEGDSKIAPNTFIQPIDNEHDGVVNTVDRPLHNERD